ncbi:hypothetical protein E4U53_001076, partial [Claviceps sorghi]
CNGGRPACDVCIKRGTDCVYRQDRRVVPETYDALRRENLALKASLDKHASMLEQLTNLSEELAIRLLRDIRARPKSVDALVASVHGSMHFQHRPSDLATAKCLFPRTDSLLEFELAARHQFIYPKTTPVDPAQVVAFLNSSALTVADEFSRRQYSPRTSSRTPSVVSGRPLDTSQSRPSSSTSSTSVPDTETLEASEPYKLCDPRLANLEIKFWTSVAIPNSLAASAISLYLESDHQMLGVFDADLFLTDLVEQRLEHCSPFLVSAVLCYACQAYNRHDPRSMSYVSQLLQEGTTLWQSERNLTRNHISLSSSSIYEPITSLAATMLMSMACQIYGRGEAGSDFLRAARQLATELELFDIVPESDRIERLGKRSESWYRSASHAAWGTYNCISAGAFYLNESPIRYPPILQIPGSADVRLNHHEDSRTPSNPLYMGRTFQAFCEFWTILQEVFVVYNRLDPRPLRERVSLAFAEAKYQKLLTWSDTVDSSVSRGDCSPGHVLIFHLIFHGMVIQLFSPFISEQTAFAEYKMQSFSSHDACPAAVVAASLNHMQYLMFQFQRQSLPPCRSTYINPPILNLADAMLNQRFRNAAGRRLFFLLCMRAWISLCSSFPFFWEFVKGFAARALKESLLSSHEARRLLRAAERQRCHHGLPEQATSTVIIDLNLAEENPKMATIKVIAEQFEDLALHEEFTTGTFDFSDDGGKV